MDETSRYHEPKKIGDIIKDMGMSPTEKKIQHTSANSAQDILDILQRYIEIVETFDRLSVHMQKLIIDIEQYQTAQEQEFLRVKKYLWEYRFTPDDIENKIAAISTTLDEYEALYRDILLYFQRTISLFDHEEDMVIYNNKLQASTNFFIDLYIQTEGLCKKYDELLELISHKQTIDNTL